MSCIKKRCLCLTDEFVSQFVHQSAFIFRPNAAIPNLELPELPEVSKLPSEHTDTPLQASPTVPEFELPDLDDLFLDEDKATQAPTTVTPDLPNLDDLF